MQMTLILLDQTWTTISMQCWVRRQNRKTWCNDSICLSLALGEGTKEIFRVPERKFEPMTRVTLRTQLIPHSSFLSSQHFTHKHVQTCSIFHTSHSVLYVYPTQWCCMIIFDHLAWALELNYHGKDPVIIISNITWTLSLSQHHVLALRTVCILI